MIVCIFTAVAFSQQQYFVGCIDNMRGDVKIFKASKNLWVPAQKLIPVEEKDTIKTGKLSFCQLILDDGSAFRLDADSQLNLQELKIEKKNDVKVQTYHLKVDFGVLLSVFNKKGDQGAKFKVRTPIAVMSIRGTDFAVSVKGNKTQVGLFDGEMGVASSENENQEIALKPDQEVNIAKGKSPEKSDFLSSNMQKQKARCQKLKEFAEEQRKKLKEHNNYIQDRIAQREKHLKEWEQKREEKLHGTPAKEEQQEEAVPAENENKTSGTVVPPANEPAAVPPSQENMGGDSKTEQKPADAQEKK